MESNSTFPSMEEATLLNTTNGNYSMEIWDEDLTVFYWVTLCVSMPGCIVNGIVIWLLGFHIKRNPFMVYILNLAVADFSFLISLSCFIISNVVGIEGFSVFHYITMILTVLIMLFGYNTGLYLLTAISMERCLAVLFPIWYKCRRSKHQSTVVCVVLWILAFLTTPMEEFSTLILYISNILHCATFIPLMVLSGVFLVVKLHKTSVKSPSFQLYVVIISSISIFLFLALPFRIFQTFLSIFDSSYFNTLLWLSFLLSAINSCINPLVYFFIGSRKKKRFRESMKVILSRALRADIGSDGQEIGTSGTLNTTA